jgi:hypothetical protein
MGLIDESAELLRARRAEGSAKAVAALKATARRALTCPIYRT